MRWFWRRPLTVGADLLCTLNIRDFEPARQFGIPVLNPGEAWQRVEEFHENK